MKPPDDQLTGDLLGGSPHPNPLPQAGEGAMQLPPLPLAGEGAMQLLPLPLAGEGRGEGDPAPYWLQLLRQAAATVSGPTAIAQAMAAANGDSHGCSRVYVSRALSGSIPAHRVSPEFARRVMATYGRIDCPHLGHSLAPHECAGHAARKWAQVQGSGPEKTLHWQACQRCPQNPQPVAHAARPAAVQPSPQPSPASGRGGKTEPASEATP